jgi:hypothetical protein
VGPGKGEAKRGKSGVARRDQHATTVAMCSKTQHVHACQQRPSDHMNPKRGIKMRTQRSVSGKVCQALRLEMGRRQRVTKARKGVSGEARRVARDWRAAPRESAMCNRVGGK